MRRLVFLLFIFLIVLIGGLVFFLNQDRFAFQTIIVNGNRVIEREAIIKVVEENFTGRRWGLFRRDRRWFYSPATIAQRLEEELVWLATATVAAPTLDSLQVTVRERRPSALWCPDPLVDVFCYYLDASGFSFHQAPVFSWRPFLVITGGQPQFGTWLMAPPEFERLKNLAAALEKFMTTTVFAEQKLGRVNLSSLGDYEFYFQSPTASSEFSLILAPAAAASAILVLLETIFDAEVFKTELAKGRQLEYLDLRFAAKLFYRFRE